ncbi:MAG TPA: GAP family protein [Solirubrobacteraceae bacterium]|nr:GAP family protein [Solirubrobacteraceae bacterium]
MGEVVLLSFTSAFNPTLIAVTTLMLLLPNPKGLMLGYWLGAMLTSITLGLLIVFSLKNSGVVSTTKHTLSPLADIVLGGLTLIIAAVLASGRDQRYRERRARKKEGKPPPRWQRELRHGSPRTTFVIGALLTLPGASYLAGLDRLTKLNYSTAVTVIIVIAFNLVMLVLLEVPMIAFALAPTATPAAIDRTKAWAGIHGRVYAERGFAAVGVLLIIKGIVGLVLAS